MIFYVTQANESKTGQLVNQFFTVRADAIDVARNLIKAGYVEVAVVKVEPHGKHQLTELLNIASGHLVMHADAEKVWPTGKTRVAKPVRVVDDIEDLLS